MQIMYQVCPSFWVLNALILDSSVDLIFEASFVIIYKGYSITVLVGHLKPTWIIYGCLVALASYMAV